MKLVKGWQQAYKMMSVQLTALLGIVAGLYPYIPALQQYLPPSILPFVAVAVIMARVIDQGASDA